MHTCTQKKYYSRNRRNITRTQKKYYPRNRRNITHPQKKNIQATEEILLSHKRNIIRTTGKECENFSLRKVILQSAFVSLPSPPLTTTSTSLPFLVPGTYIKKCSVQHLICDHVNNFQNSGTENFKISWVRVKSWKRQLINVYYRIQTHRKRSTFHSSVISFSERQLFKIVETMFGQHAQRE